MQRHRHQEFIRFLNRIEREVPADKAIHVILDNYAAHKKDKVQEWLARHPRWTFHFTPTSCSWLNAVEGFFAKAQGEEAEARLHTLLGSVRDTSQKGDAGTYGALGLLWVAQTDALAVTAPGQIVRDTVRSTLEAEVGSIMGGPAYKRVRTRIDEQFARYWSPTGQKRERQNEVRERVESAETGARDAADRLAGLEKTFAELEAARARLKVVQREIADDTDVQTRKDLVASLEVARAAAQILATRRAEHEAVSAKGRGLEDLSERHRSATEDRDKASLALEQARAKRTDLGEGLAAAKQRLVDAREALESARKARQDARVALGAGEDRVRAARRKRVVRLSGTGKCRKGH